MSPALIALLPFLGALLPGLMVRAGRDAAAAACATATGLALLGLCLHIPAVLAGEVIATRLPWMPQIGLNADFRIDGLGLLFGILILGIGLLIILYARFYLSEKDAAGPFFTYLMLFQGAMAGIVLTDNILMLLVFWELTSLSSFLLIGFWKHLPEGRQGARMALAVTGMGGLAMIAGMLILGRIAGLGIVTVDHGRVRTTYQPVAAVVSRGEQVREGQVIGRLLLAGSHCAPVACLHWGLIRGDAYLDPLTLVGAVPQPVRLYPW